MDTEVGLVFFRRKGRVIRYLERHQGIAMESWYLDTTTGNEFDVRELPKNVIGGVDAAQLNSGDRAIHKLAIRAAIDAGHDFAPRKFRGGAEDLLNSALTSG